MKTTTGGQVAAAVAGTDYASVASLFGKSWEVSGNFLAPTTTTYVTNIQQASSTLFSALQGKFGATASTTIDTAGNVAVAGTLDVTGKTTLASATTTNISATYASSTSGFFGNLSIGSLSGFLKATAGAISTALVDLASNVTGILAVGNGGTGWSNVASGAVVLGNGSGSLATTTAGTNGQVLALVSGTPTWVATTSLSTISGTLSVASGGTGQTTFTSSQLLYGNATNGLSSVATSSASCSSGVSCSTFTVVGSVSPSITNTGLLSLTQNGGGSAQTGAITFGTSTATSFNGLSISNAITNSSGTFTFAPDTITGTLNVAGGGTGLASYTAGSVLYASGATTLAGTTTANLKATLALNNVENTALSTWAGSTNLTTLGTITSGTWNGTTIDVPHGGTNITSYTSGDILYASAATTLSRVASSTDGFVLALQNGKPSWVATTSLSTIGGTLAVGSGGTGATSLTGLLQGNGASAITGVTGNAGQFPYYNGTNTLLATSTLFVSTASNVGIGTTTPNSVLEVSGTQADPTTSGTALNGMLRIGQATAGGSRLLDFGVGASGAWLQSRDRNSYATNYNLLLNPNGGNVGIGKTPATTLDVQGTIRSVAFTTPSSGKGIELFSSSGDSSIQSYDRDGSAFKLLDLYGSTVTTHNTSDVRLKTAISDLTATSGLDGILQLHPVTFRWKDTQLDQQKGVQIGLIAQEVQNVFPALVTVVGTSTAILADGSKVVVPDTHTLDYEGFIVPLIKAVQDIATITGTFKTNLIAWLGDAANGIDKIFAREIVATNGTFRTVTADKLCLGSRCMTAEQFNHILDMEAAAGTPTSGVASGGTGGSSTGATSGPPPITTNSGDAGTLVVNGNNPAEWPLNQILITPVSPLSF